MLRDPFGHLFETFEAFPWDTAPRYLLRDRDKSYGPAFRHRVRAMGITEVITAPRSPWQNPYAERLIGSIRRECLDHVIILSERHLRRVLSSYFQYHQRPNASLAQQGLPTSSPHTASLRRQYYCLPGGRRSALSLRASSRVRWRGGTLLLCVQFIFEQGQGHAIREYDHYNRKHAPDDDERKVHLAMISPWGLFD